MSLFKSNDPRHGSRRISTLSGFGARERLMEAAVEGRSMTAEMSWTAVPDDIDRFVNAQVALLLKRRKMLPAETLVAVDGVESELSFDGYDFKHEGPFTVLGPMGVAISYGLVTMTGAESDDREDEGRLYAKTMEIRLSPKPIRRV